MKSFFYHLLFIGLFFNYTKAQKIVSTEISTVNFEADSFVGLDNFENYFYIKDNILFKKTNQTILQYQNLALGKLTKVDLTNALKIVLFYEKFNTVIVLDNQLNEIQKIDFSKIENPVVASAIGLSGQNQIWVYNTLNQQIGLYDLTSNTFKNLGIPINEMFSYYQTDFNYFYWIDKQNQWMSCSIFGRVVTNGKIGSFDQIQIIDATKLIYLKNNQLYFRDITKSTVFEIGIVENSFINFYYKDQILSIFTNKGISNYKIVLP